MIAYPTISIPKLHAEYQTWMEELNFYKEEIKIFEHHLEAITSKNKCQDVLSWVEHFQNLFIRQKEVIDTLKHNLNVSEKQLSAFVKDRTGMGLSNIKMDNHASLREEMMTFRKLFAEMKADFRNFETGCR